MIASLYAMLSRFVTSLGAERHLLIPAKRFTRIFVLSDVLTFLIQVSKSVFQHELGTSANEAP